MTKIVRKFRSWRTKFVCAVGDENFNVVEKHSFLQPRRLKRWIRRLPFSLVFDNLAGLAVGSFGPIDIDPNSGTYGYITTTPNHIGRMWTS